MSKDMVKRSDHYCFSKFEPKDVIREWGLNFNLGSAVKYIARAGRKDDIVQDLKKAREFLSFEIEALEAERGVTEEEQKELEEITKKNAEISRALRFYRGFRGLVSKLSNDYCMKRLGVDDMLDGYTVDFHLIVPRGVSIDKAVDQLIEQWEGQLNENCKCRV